MFTACNWVVCSSITTIHTPIRSSSHVANRNPSAIHVNNSICSSEESWGRAAALVASKREYVECRAIVRMKVDDRCTPGDHTCDRKLQLFQCVDNGVVYRVLVG